VTAAFDVDALDFDKNGGLIPVIAQDARTGAVLMLAYADREAIDKTVATGEVHFRSRRRGLWRKGETSGNVLRLVSLHADCDTDTVLAVVVPAGPTCHTGQTTCFGEVDADAMVALERVIAERAKSGDARSYTRKLLDDRNLRLKKIGEEATELVVALTDGDASRIAEEAADVVYHLMVALQAAGVPMDAVREVLRARAK
jgi:phosphoribosyl-ATP pyrophosphohydrolase/phosphoribosyl-AMP cyclohydrolase